MRTLRPFVLAITAILVVYVPPEVVVQIAVPRPVTFDAFFVTFALRVALFVLLAVALKAPPDLLAKGQFPLRGLQAITWLLLSELAIAILIVATIATTATSTVGNTPSELIDRFYASFPDSGLVGGLLADGLLRPILEESLFRGLILGHLLQAINPLLSIPFSSLLFAVGHGSAWPIAFLSGTLLGLLYFRFRSVWLCILAHAGNNLLIAAAAPLSIAYLNELYPGLGLEGRLLAFQICCFVVGFFFLGMFLRDILGARNSKKLLTSDSLDATSPAA